MVGTQAFLAGGQRLSEYIDRQICFPQSEQGVTQGRLHRRHFKWVADGGAVQFLDSPGQIVPQGVPQFGDGGVVRLRVQAGEHRAEDLVPLRRERQVPLGLLPLRDRIVLGNPLRPG